MKNEQEKKPNSKDIQHFSKRKGKIIRKQYFNVGITACFCVALFLISGGFFDFIINGAEFSLDDIILVISIFGGVFAAPFIVLSILNRLFFGFPICLLTNDGIIYDDSYSGTSIFGDLLDYLPNLLFGATTEESYCEQFIPWNEIQSMTFRPLFLGGTTNVGRSTQIVVKTFDGAIEHTFTIGDAPFHLLRRAKKYNPNIKTTFSKWPRILIIALPVLIALAVVLF